MDRGLKVPTALWLVLCPAGIGFGALSLVIARHEPAYALAGGSTAAAGAELAAGYALLAAGFAAWARRPRSRFGVLLVVASLGWFLAEWNNPGIGSAIGFTIGLVLYGVGAALVAHAALGYPGGHLASSSARVGVLGAYAALVLVLGLMPALVFDPADACGECPSNLVLVRGSPSLFDALGRVGVCAGLAAALALIVLLALRLRGATAAMRVLAWPVLLAAGAYLALVAADFAHGLSRGFVANDATDRALRLSEAGALVALAFGVAWSWLHGRRTRGAVARLVVELAEAPVPGGLRDALAETLGDPSLVLAYPLEGGRLVDARGRPLDLHGEVTPLVRDGRKVAFLSHRPGLLDDPVFVEEVAVAARLAFEHEHLQAETRAQLEDLRSARARVIATGDAERRRLERDLHDGAQQRLVGIALSLRLARAELGHDPDAALLARIEEADAELRAALAELRELAHGIFPAVLADEGLAAALDVLAEEAPIAVRLGALPDARLGADVETAGYFVVSDLVSRSHAGRVDVDARRIDGRLVIELSCDGPLEDLVDLEDRVGALDGGLNVVRGPDGRARIRVEIPCGS